MAPLARFAGRTLLGQCLSRLKASGANVVVVTTGRRDDDAIVREASRYRADVHRSGAHDALGRLVDAAETFHLHDVLCASPYHPAVDIDAPARMLELRRRSRVDSITECGLPPGAAVDVVTVEALQRAERVADMPHQRQYVTSFIRRDARFTTLCAVAPGTLRQPGLRLVADTPATLEHLDAVFMTIGGDAPLEAIAGAAVRHLPPAAADVLSLRGA